MKNPKLPVLLILLCLGALLNPARAQDTSRVRKIPIKIVKTQYGVASFYHDKFQGRKTATGELFDQKKMTAAHNSLPLHTWIKVTSLRNGKTVIVKVNDRLHHKNTRLVDLSRVAAEKLGYVGRGLTRVKVEVLGKKKPKELIEQEQETDDVADSKQAGRKQ